MNKGIVEASIITIGDELLIGQVVDTNSAWMAQQLNKIGIWVKRRVAVGDSWNDIWNALDEESRNAKVIFITGGLGPTADDITKPLLCKYFDGKMIMNEEVLNHIKFIFKKILNRPFIERNEKQAEVPDVCSVIHNQRGTAPGMWFEKNEKIYISLPGVPHEMMGMMTDLVLPKLQKRVNSHFIIHRTLLTAGIGESYLAEHIKNWEAALTREIKLAYLPNYGMVRLRLTATGNEKEILESQLNHEFDELKKLVAEWLVIDEDLSMPQVINKMLKDRKKLVATAESCTGGYIAHLITREPGASDKYNGSIVCYSNQVKEDLLQVSHQTLSSVGAVSKEAVEEMVRGAVKTLKADYVIATSGIMGPDGGTPEKPVGMVWIGVGSSEKIVAQQFNFRFDRMRNIELTAINALNLLRKFILDSES